jgi:hypothetical protein
LSAAMLAAGEAEAPTARQVNQAQESGLKWLAEKQIKEGANAGSWECARYHTAVASLAGLAFLANGHLPGKGEYGKVIDRSMAFVQAGMKDDGYLGGPDNSMYVHAICTLFGLSYLGMSPAPEKETALAEWCRKSIALIVTAQKMAKWPGEEGGWRYEPTSRESDLSVTSWQVLALHAARQCGYEIDNSIFDATLKYVNSAFVDKGAEATGFLYRPRSTKEAEPGVTGVAVFLKALLEREPDDRTAKSLKYLQQFQPAWSGARYKGYFFFGTFYQAQGMFQVGGETWSAFAPKLQRVFIDHQEGDGSWAFPADNTPQSREAGIGYATAMSVLILSLDKQFLPMYQRQSSLF